MSRWIKYIGLLTLLLHFSSIAAQELLLNASFERCNLCPKKLGSFDSDVVHWTSPTLGSTDYFNSCSSYMGTPENFNGKQAAHTGTAYAGFYLFAPDDYREYVQTRLDKPLIEGREYELTFFISRAERSDYAIREIGILMADRELEVATKKTLSKKHWFGSGVKSYTFLPIKSGDYWEETNKWEKLQTSFVAKGTEKYLVVGNFNSNRGTRISETTRGANKGAYYYIDSFSLEAKEEQQISENTVVTAEETNLALNTTHRFQNVLFRFDESDLLDEAKVDIERVYGYLESNTDIKILIDGYTDNVGSAKYNWVLSNHRCEAVANYLMQLGLEKDRISWKGHGGKNPIADNSTDEGRKLNRRVEFMFVRNDPPN